MINFNFRVRLNILDVETSSILLSDKSTISSEKSTEAL